MYGLFFRKTHSSNRFCHTAQKYLDNFEIKMPFFSKKIACKVSMVFQQLEFLVSVTRDSEFGYIICRRYEHTHRHVLTFTIWNTWCYDGFVYFNPNIVWVCIVWWTRVSHWATMDCVHVCVRESERDSDEWTKTIWRNTLNCRDSSVFVCECMSELTMWREIYYRI